MENAVNRESYSLAAGLALGLVMLEVLLKLNLKGLGHGILGNFSIDQLVIELTEISK